MCVSLASPRTAQQSTRSPHTNAPPFCRRHFFRRSFHHQIGSRPFSQSTIYLSVFFLFLFSHSAFVMAQFNPLSAPWGGFGSDVSSPSILDQLTTDLHALCEEAWARDATATPPALAATATGGSTASASATAGTNIKKAAGCGLLAVGSSCFSSAATFSSTSSFGTFGLGSSSSACCGASDDGSGSSLHSEASGATAVSSIFTTTIPTAANQVGPTAPQLQSQPQPQSQPPQPQQPQQAFPDSAAAPAGSGSIIATLPTQLQPVQFVSLEYLRLLAKSPTPVTRVNFVQRPPGVPAQLLRAGSNGAAVSIIGGVPVTIRGGSRGGGGGGHGSRSRRAQVNTGGGSGHPL